MGATPAISWMLCCGAVLLPGCPAVCLGVMIIHQHWHVLLLLHPACSLCNQSDVAGSDSVAACALLVGLLPC